MQDCRPHSPTDDPGRQGDCSLTEIASMTREQLMDHLLHFKGKVHLDFTEGFLTPKSTARLRHLLVAASKVTGKPDA